MLVDGGKEILATFGDRLSEKAARELRRLGVTIRTGTVVTGVDAFGVDVRTADGSRERLLARTKIWAAGVQASPLAGLLAEASGATCDRAGRIVVLEDCTLPGHPEVFAIGDMMALDDLPGVAEVAMQSGIHAANTIKRRLHGKEAATFTYRDLGSMATISRFHAVVSFKGLRVSGFLGWLMWLFVHITFLTGFKNRLAAMFHWAGTFLVGGRAERTITLRQVIGRVAIDAGRRGRRSPGTSSRRRAAAGTIRIRSASSTPVTQASDRGRAVLTDALASVALAVDPVPWARSQMAFTLAFHIILVPLGVSWSVMTLIANYRGIKHDDRDAMLLAQRWSKYMAVTFAVGAVTGTVLSFEFGLLWPKFMGQWGAAFGVPFAFEGIFFFTEAVFISIYIFGWRRLKPWAHFWTGVPIAVAGIFGSISVVAANAWMNSPAGRHPRLVRQGDRRRPDGRDLQRARCR